MKNKKVTLLIILNALFITIAIWQIYRLSMENIKAWKLLKKYQTALSQKYNRCKISELSGDKICLSHKIIEQQQHKQIDKNSQQNSYRYDNTLTINPNPLPILSRFPEFTAPIIDDNRFLSSPLVLDENPNLLVLAWRYSANARGIIETQNKLNGDKTAIIVVHPWGIDDGQGFATPEPAGVSFFWTPEKNRIYLKHTKKVLKPFLNRLKGQTAMVAYSLPGNGKPYRNEVYKSPRNQSRGLDREKGLKSLKLQLKRFKYMENSDIIANFLLSKKHPVYDYFSKFPGLSAGDAYNGPGYWELPIPIVSTLDITKKDIVLYDGHGYAEIRNYLSTAKITNILLAGYATDMCLKKTAAGYNNLKKDFNVFIVGDATMATFPSQSTPKYATSVALANASLNNLITETSWISIIHK